VSHLISTVGPPVVFLAAFLEAFAIPIPAELVLVTAAVVAQHGDLSLGSVLGSATTGAITGQAGAYVLGRVRGRRMLEWRPLARLAGPHLASAEAFFARHGGKAVFLGRFVPILRSTIGWMAGVGGLPPARYATWNVAGALAWALSIGLGAYYFGKAAVDAVQTWGTIGILLVAAVAVLLLAGTRAWRRRTGKRSMVEALEP
jgi:membrane-associated protein